MLDVAQRKLARFGTNFQAQIGDARQLENAGLQFPGALCARLLMHLPMEEQIQVLRAVASAAPIVVLTHGLSTPYHRLRRKLKRLLGNQRPAAFPISSKELSLLLAGAGLKEIARMWIFPLVSEAIMVVAKRSHPNECV
jgi:hypothetical protein